MVKSIVVLGAFALSAASASAAIVPVSVSSFQFSPARVTINPGDTIRWTWSDGFHTTTSVRASTEQWNSNINPNVLTFDHTFNSPGTFWYYCQPHGSDQTISNPNANPPAVGMAGSITVVPAPAGLVLLASGGLIVARRRRDSL